MPKTTSYGRRKQKGLCVTGCGSVAIGRTHCDDCSIRATWATLNRLAKQDGYAPIALSADQFVTWYKVRRKAADGRCEWCHALFDKTGPHANYDHGIGSPRNLVCAPCHRASALGVERLQQIVAAMTGVAVSALGNCVDVNFPRWKREIDAAWPNSDVVIGDVVAQINLRCASREEFHEAYRRFHDFVWPA